MIPERESCGVRSKLSKHRTICIVSQYWSPDVSGDVTRLKEILDVLESKGIRIRLVTSFPHYPNGRGGGTRDADLQTSNFRVFRVSMPHIPHKGFLNRLVLYSWFSFFASFQVLTLSRGVAVWTFSQRIFSTLAGLPSKIVWKVPLISDVTDVWPDALVNTGYASSGGLVFRFGRALAMFSYRHCDAISTMTDRMARILSVNNRLSPSKIFVLPYVWHPSRSSGSRSVFRVLYFGNLGPNYDLGIVVRVAKLLEDKGVEVIIRGDGERLAELRADIGRIGPNNLRLLSSTMTTADLNTLISSADVLVLPMVRQVFPDVSFPGKFVEYLFSGKPIVYVGEGLPAEMIVKYQVGSVVQYDDDTGLRDAILTIKENPTEAKRKGENAMELGERMFNHQKLEDAIMNLLDWLEN